LEVFKSKNTFNQSGFTLVEVLIAIVLISFITLFGYQMVDSNITTKETVTKEDGEIVQVVTALSKIERDFSELYSPLFYSPKNIANSQNQDNQDVYDSSTQNSAFESTTKNFHLIPQITSEEKSSITFFSSSNRRKIMDSKESRYNWIKYSLRQPSPEDLEDEDNKETDENKKKNSLQLIRQSIATNIFKKDINFSDVKAQVLLDNVKSFEISFWDEKQKKFTSSITELNEFRNSLRAIKLEVVWYDANYIEQKTEKILRIIFPFYNTKIDELKSGVPTYDGAPPPNLPDPSSTQKGEDVNE